MPVEDFILHEMTERFWPAPTTPRAAQAVAEWNAHNPMLKKGLALTPVKFGISFTLTHLNQAGALVHVYQDGSIHMNHGGTEMGQGLFQKVAQVAATASACRSRRSRSPRPTPPRCPTPRPPRPPPDPT
jgi:xanthine dehydrogenase large subunit